MAFYNEGEEVIARLGETVIRGTVDQSVTERSTLLGIRPEGTATRNNIFFRDGWKVERVTPAAADIFDSFAIGTRFRAIKRGSQTQSAILIKIGVRHAILQGGVTSFSFAESQVAINAKTLEVVL